MRCSHRVRATGTKRASAPTAEISLNVLRSLAVIYTKEIKSLHLQFIAALIGLSLASIPMVAQSFDVASIRPSRPGTQGHLSAENGRLTGEGFSLSGYIIFAWNLALSREQLDAMVVHLPKWVSTESFDIQARAEGSPTQNQIRLMLKSLLADRFGLAVHFETAQTPVLALVLEKPGKTGPQLRPHSEGPPCRVPLADVFPPICDQVTATSKPNHAVLMGSRDSTIKQIAAWISSLGRLDRPVVDQTGLTGPYDFTLEFTPQPKGLPPPDQTVQPDVAGTTLLEALQEQLGLRLKPATAPLDTLVVDHVERPSEN